MEQIKAHLIETVRMLSEEIGQRSYMDITNLNKTASYIEERFSSFGYDVERQPFDYNGNRYFNIIGEVKGSGDSPDGCIVIGAHYDTVVGTPGADDNASGIAGLLELARLTSEQQPAKTVRFVAFCLEEPPVFMSSRMGSYVYAESLKARRAAVEGMISLEMLGYYSDRVGSQYYPSSLFKLFYPDRGDFVAFVGNIASKNFTRKVKQSFQLVSDFPVESLNAPSLIPGVDFSDHRSFWKFGYPAFMITDTAFYRNPHYHAPSDTSSTLDYDRMARLVAGLSGALRAL